MEYFKILPVDITVNILTRLPTESVLHCKSVCKSWNHLVSHYSGFSKMHLDNLMNHAADSGKLCFIAETWFNKGKLHYFEYNEATPIERIRRFHLTLTSELPGPGVSASVVGSCNGLICLSTNTTVLPPIYICNPITRECVVLPQMNRDGINRWSTGFGYVRSTNEYKVVVMVLKPEFVNVHIYTLGSGRGWRNLGNFESAFSTFSWERGIFANGVLYWMGSNSKMIVTFDLAEETFCKHLAPPPLRPKSNWRGNKIGVLDGFLFLAIEVYEGDVNHHDIWLLRNKNDNHDMKEPEDNQSLGWTKEFRVLLERKEYMVDITKLLAITKSDGRVITHLKNYLDIYDTKTSTSERLVEFKKDFHGVFLHKNTLVSLRELGEENMVELELTKEFECLKLL